MSETPNQKRRREQHEKLVATYDGLIGSFQPMAKLNTRPDSIVEIAAALQHVAAGVTLVLEQMKAEALADYEKTRDWT